MSYQTYQLLHMISWTQQMHRILYYSKQLNNLCFSDCHPYRYYFSCVVYIYVNVVLFGNLKYLTWLESITWIIDILKSRRLDIILIVASKTVVTPVLTHWKHCCLAPSYQFITPPFNAKNELIVILYEQYRCWHHVGAYSHATGQYDFPWG